VKHKLGLYLSLFLFGFLLAAANASAQTIGYRLSNLASNRSNVANNVSPELVNPWGLASLSDQPFSPALFLTPQLSRSPCNRMDALGKSRDP